MKKLLLALALVSFPAFAEVPTVRAVQLQSYLGLWYELVRMPNDFQDEIDHDGSGFSECRYTTARYGLLSHGRLSVENRCVRVNSRGLRQTEVARAKAEVVEGSRGAKLKVNFTGSDFLEYLGIGDGDYWVMELGPKNARGQYSYSLVVSPTREYAWILSRTPQLPDATIRRLIERLKREGFDTRGLVYSR
jgi:apolipoprotein D and lipocalin family protein